MSAARKKPALAVIVRPVPIAEAHSFSLHRFSDTSHLPPDLHTV